jgi:hypothetical protein
MRRDRVDGRARNGMPLASDGAAVLAGTSHQPPSSRHSLRVTTAWQVAIIKLKSIAETYLISALPRRLVALPERSRSNRESICNASKVNA